MITSTVTIPLDDYLKLTEDSKSFYLLKNKAADYIVLYKYEYSEYCLMSENDAISALMEEIRLLKKAVNESENKWYNKIFK